MTSKQRRGTPGSSPGSGQFWTPDKVRAAAARKAGNRTGSVPSFPRHQNRHGRGDRGTLLFPALPAWRTRREQFYELVQEALDHFVFRCPEVATIEFGIEEVPPSDPAEWESHDQVLARAFPRDRRRGLADRVVIYRLPVVQRAGRGQVAAAVYTLLAQRISELLEITPEELLR
mgnify:CR=1 FL=1